MVEPKQDLQGIGISLVSEVFELVLKWGSNAFRHVCDYTTKAKFMCSHWPWGSSLRSLLVLGHFVPLQIFSNPLDHLNPYNQLKPTRRDIPKVEDLLLRALSASGPRSVILGRC